MEKKKVLFNKDFLKKNIHIIIFIVVVILFHVVIKDFNGDDLKFAKAFEENDSIFSFWELRYTTWSSRLIIETILAFISRYGLIIWKILDCFIYFLLFYSTKKICRINNKAIECLIMALLFVIPIPVLNNTGWLSTTTNYLWVLTFGLYSLSVIIDYIDNKKIPVWKYILYTLSFIYAINQEQMAVVAFGVLLIFIIYEVVCKKLKSVLKNDKFIIFLIILALISIIFTLTCPGNAVRKVANTEYWYPEYANFNIIEKIELGVTSTIDKLMLGTNNLYIVFVISMFVGALTLCKKKHVKVISSILFVVGIFYTFFIDYLALLIPNANNFIQRFKIQTLIMPMNQIRISSLIMIIVEICIFLLILYVLFKIFDNKKKGIVLSLVYIFGMMSRFVMCFSPTIFASGERTFIYLYYSFVICSVMIISEVVKKYQKKYIE